MVMRVENSKIEIDAPNVGELEKQYINEAIDSGFVSSVGPCIAAFEQKIAAFTHAKAAVVVQSGTAAIFLALNELGIGSGDEVIVSALTFTATVNPILYVGATPVFVDVDPSTWNMDPAKLKAAITPKTKAILPVHLYGNPCQMQEVMAIANAHGLHVIEDATESLGATFNGTHTGLFGDFGCFSFNGNKLITTGGGGAIISNDVAKIEHIRYLANQAKDKDKPSFHSEMGFNFRMTNIEAALGLAQFEKIGMFLAQKKQFNAIYQQAMSKNKNTVFQQSYDQAQPSYWLSCLMVNQPVDIMSVMHQLASFHIPTRRIFMPVHQMPYLRKFAVSCPQAERIYQQGLCLPSSTLNQISSMEKAATMINEVLNGHQ